jgi:hypothetical protein
LVIAYALVYFSGGPGLSRRRIKRRRRHRLIIGNPRNSASADRVISYAPFVLVVFGVAKPAICARRYSIPSLVSDEVVNISG